MKTKVAMAISLAGVLAAGTAAALVNTQVLNGGSSGSGLADAAQVEQTVPATSPLGTPGSEVAPPSSAVTEQPVATASPTQAIYAIGDAGTVTLDTAGDALTIVSAAPGPGWVVTQSETDDGRNAEVKFQAGNIEVEFHANLLYGVVNTAYETHDLSAPSSSVAGGDDEGGDDGGQHDGGDDGGGYDDD